MAVSMVDLDDYGLTGGVAADFAAVASPGALLGRVLRVERGECDVVTAQGELRVASDSRRAQSDLAPATGDWVSVVVPDDAGPVMEAILCRDRVLLRRDPSEEVVPQVLVANVDRVAVVHGLDRPFRPGRLERFLVLIWSSGAAAAVILTKSDSGDPADALATVASVAPGTPTLVTSASTGQGLDEVVALTAPRTTTALVGESGSGKSTLVNVLAANQLQEVGEVRAGDHKGRHTTITRDLVRLPHGGLVVDTPGVRAVGLWEGHDALQRVFADVIELGAGCRFGDCAHGTEPGCAVREAVERGEVSERRLRRYTAMVAELDEVSETNRRRAGPRRRR